MEKQVITMLSIGDYLINHRWMCDCSMLLKIEIAGADVDGIQMIVAFLNFGEFPDRLINKYAILQNLYFMLNQRTFL